MKKKSKFIQFDTSRNYIIPMNLDSERLDINTEKPVVCNITQSLKDGFVTIRKEGYQTKHFVDFYFQYLIDIGYIKYE